MWTEPITLVSSPMELIMTIKFGTVAYIMGALCGAKFSHGW